MTHGLDTSFLLAVEIVEHTHHAVARACSGSCSREGDRVAIAPQVLTEFVHVETDARRFQQPFSMETALTNRSAGGTQRRRTKSRQPMSRLRFSIPVAIAIVSQTSPNAQDALPSSTREAPPGAQASAPMFR